MDIMERARRWENRTKDAFVSVFFGYPWSDVPDVAVDGREVVWAGVRDVEAALAAAEEEGA